jgi:hypothetical protein
VRFQAQIEIPHDKRLTKPAALLLLRHKRLRVAQTQLGVDGSTIKSLRERLRVAFQTLPWRCHLQRHIGARREDARVLDRIADVGRRAQLLRRHVQLHLAEAEHQGSRKVRLHGRGGLSG